jgi:signal transduction histidine kinase
LNYWSKKTISFHCTALVIQDDGVGFDLSSNFEEDSGKGLGLAGMRERVDITAGTFSI